MESFSLLSFFNFCLCSYVCFLKTQSKRIIFKKDSTFSFRFNHFCSLLAMWLFLLGMMQALFPFIFHFSCFSFTFYSLQISWMSTWTTEINIMMMILILSLASEKNKTSSKFKTSANFNHISQIQIVSSEINDICMFLYLLWILNNNNIY